MPRFLMNCLLFVACLGATGSSVFGPGGYQEADYKLPVLIEGGRLASESTRTLDASMFLVERPDFSLASDVTLLRKAKIEQRRGALLKLAEQGNAYAQLLVGLRPGAEDDMVMIEKAARQGLIRAVALRAAVLARKNGPDRPAHVKTLKDLMAMGSPYAMYLYAFVGDDDQGRAEALARSARLGFAPAMVIVAKQLFETGDPRQRGVAIALAEKAADRGDDDARALLKAFPPSPDR